MNKRRDRIITKMTRYSAWLKQDYCCFYCRSKLRKHEVTADHKIPKSKGGTLENSNIVAACERCNKAKATLSEKQFMNLLKRRPEGLPWNILMCSVTRKMNLQVERSIRNIKKAVDQNQERYY